MLCTLRRTASLVALTVAALAPQPSFAQKMVASTWMPVTHEISTTMMQWAEDVARATDGRVAFQLLPKPGASPQGTFDAVRNGVIDLGFTVHGYTPGRFVLTQMAELPFLGDSAEAVSVAYQRIHEKHLAKAGEHQGVRVLAVFTHGPGIVHNMKRPVQSIADLDGLKFRVGGGMATEIAKAIGVNATLKPAPESYELLSSGVMDGVFLPAESIEAYRLEKLIRHSTTFPGGLYNTSFVMLMSEKRYAALSEADRRTIDRLAGVELARRLGRAWDRADRKGTAYMQAGGVAMVKASPQFSNEVRGKVSGLENRWMEAAKAKGIGDPAAVLKEFRQLATSN
jgi:TRAP-type C4-dicarboxylate transport system substrate-binding protein